MKVGYIRVSTANQNPARQEVLMQELGVDIIFMDPPYQKDLEKQVLLQLSNSGLLKEDSLIIVEADLDTSFDYVESYGFEVLKFKRYKTNMHVFLQKKAEETNE